jgi:hypothetical protein
VREVVRRARQDDLDAGGHVPRRVHGAGDDAGCAQAPPRGERAAPGGQEHDGLGRDEPRGLDLVGGPGPSVASAWHPGGAVEAQEGHARHAGRLGSGV